MSKKPLIALVLLIACLGASSNEAQAASYFALSAGMSSLDVSKSDFDSVLQGLPASSSLDDSDFAWSAQIGYRWGNYIAAELGYFDLGEANYRADVSGIDEHYTLRLTSSGPTLSVLGMLPVGDHIDLHARAGLIYSDTRFVERLETAAGEVVDSFGDKAHAKDLFVGIGAAWNIGMSFGLRLEYQRFFDVGDDDVTGETDIDVITFGVLFR